MAGKRIALAAFGVLATIVFVLLGIWQVERRAWKLDLIARVEARVHASAVPLPDATAWPQITERDDAYRRVRASGTFVHRCEAQVQALTALGAGFWVMTPLDTAQGPVFVNRGFVSTERRDPSTRAAGQVEGPVEITGLLRMDETRGTILRDNDPAAGRWYSRDVAAMAAACGLPTPAPFFVDADAAPNPGGLPVGGQTVVAFRNSHLVYALTWFSMALLSMFGTGLVLRSRSDR